MLSTAFRLSIKTAKKSSATIAYKGRWCIRSVSKRQMNIITRITMLFTIIFFISILNGTSFLESMALMMNTVI